MLWAVPFKVTSDALALSAKKSFGVERPVQFVRGTVYLLFVSTCGKAKLPLDLIAPNFTPFTFTRRLELVHLAFTSICERMCLKFMGTPEAP